MDGEADGQESFVTCMVRGSFGSYSMIPPKAAKSMPGECISNRPSDELMPPKIAKLLPARLVWQ